MNLGIANRITVQDGDMAETVRDLQAWVDEDTPTMPSRPSVRSLPTYSQIVLMQQKSNEDTLFAEAGDHIAQRWLREVAF